MTNSHADEISNLYTQVKNLLKSEQYQEARKLLQQTRGLEEIWEDLLHLAMERRNCPVTKLVLVVIARLECLTKEDLKNRISRIDHGIQIKFMSRVHEYIESKNFEKEYERYARVRAVAAAQLKGRFGAAGFISPKDF